MTDIAPTRRQMVAGALGVLGATTARAPAIAQARATKLTIMSHAVHKAVATGTKGGDSTAAWRQRTGLDAEWITFSVEGVHERHSCSKNNR